MSNRNLLLILSLNLLFLAGCRKACTHDYLPESVKPFLFKAGSWWVYDNSATGNRDTFKVVKVVSEVMHGLTPVACRGEQLDEVFDMTVVNRSDTFKLIAFGEPRLFIHGNSSPLSGFVLDASLAIGECTRLDTSLCCVGVSPLTVGAYYFNEAIQMKSVISNTSGVHLGTYDLFWVKNVGLVKMVRRDSPFGSLSLVEYNVIQ